MIREAKLALLQELDRQIDAATGWGAWLGAVIEWRDELAQELELPVRRLVDGKPLAD